MKRGCVICLLMFILFSCGNQGQGADGYVKPDANNAVNILPTLWIYSEAEGKVDGKYLGTIDAGETVEWKNKVENNEKNWEYGLVKRNNGQEVWALSMYLIRGTRPGITTKEGFIYTEPSPGKMSKDKIDAYTMVAGLREPKFGNFTQVSFTYPRDKGTSIRARVYVKSDIVSFLNSDIQAAALYKKADVETKAANDKELDIKKEFLKSALELESPAFKQMIQTALTNLENGSGDNSNNSYVSSGGEAVTSLDPPVTYMILDNDVGCYSEPSTDSKSNSTFANKDKVKVDQRTTNKRIVEGHSNYWFHVQGKGWVFGEYVQESND